MEFLIPLLDSEGLLGVYEENLSKLSEDFLSLSDSAQDESMRRYFTTPFLELVARQTIEGYYANPENGGNKDGVAWQMIGFEVTA